MKAKEAHEPTFTRESQIWEVVEAFRNRSLPKEEWTHSAHLVVALAYCRHFSVTSVKRFLRDEIRLLNAAHGTPNTNSSGYHETLTVFWIRTVAGFLVEAADDATTVELANRLIDSYKASYPLESYSRERLFSAAARKNFIKPDLITNF